ncbi:MAG: hypothetical protein SGI87_07875 [Flavobacteriales bacterium]|nr:hypothetical protein [Flavobacteriales bacterium]
MIVEASISGVLKIIFYIILFSALIRFVAHLAAPYVIRNAQEALKERMRSQQEQNQQRREGDITIEKSPKSAKDDKGEYVDYVEIKE